LNLPLDIFWKVAAPLELQRFLQRFVVMMFMMKKIIKNINITKNIVVVMGFLIFFIFCLLSVWVFVIVCLLFFFSVQ